MKKYICIVLTLVMLMTMFACTAKKYDLEIGDGESIQSETKIPKAKETESQSPKSKAALTEGATNTAPTVNESTETDPSVRNVSIDWTKIKQTVTDSDGYTYEVTYKFSPWILHSNSDIINSAWKEVSKDKVLPSSLKDWGLKCSNKSFYSRGNIKSSCGAACGSVCFGFDMTDMYYCVGTVSVNNTTSGWDITKESPRNMSFALRWNYVNEAWGAGSLCNVFYNNKTDLITDYVSIAPMMDRNSWGSVPFVLMVPENFSPKYPDGKYYEYHRMGYFGLDYNGRDYNTKIHLGIIGKDGSYTPPEQ